MIMSHVNLQGYIFWRTCIRWVGDFLPSTILLMEEILHHLGCIKPCKWWDIYHINWWMPDFFHQQQFQRGQKSQECFQPIKFPFPKGVPGHDGAAGKIRIQGRVSGFGVVHLPGSFDIFHTSGSSLASFQRRCASLAVKLTQPAALRRGQSWWWTQYEIHPRKLTWHWNPPFSIGNTSSNGGFSIGIEN